MITTQFIMIKIGIPRLSLMEWVLISRLKHCLDQLGYNPPILLSRMDMAVVVSMDYIPGECLRYFVRVLLNNDDLIIRTYG